MTHFLKTIHMITFSVMYMAFCMPIYAMLVIDIKPATLAGERAQHQGVISALRHLQPDLRYLSEEDVQMKNNATLEPQQIAHIRRAIDTQDEPFLILTGGNQAFDVLTSLNLTPAQREKALIVLTAHQMWDNWPTALKQNPQTVDIIALPQYVALPSIPEGPLFIRTPGVCHNKSPESVKETYKNRDKSLYNWDTTKNYLLLILPGDLQNSQGKWVPFSQEEAAPLVTLVEDKMHEMGEGAFLLITNGPRTGHIDPQTGENATVLLNDGKWGKYHDQGAPLDPVTHAMTEALATKGIPLLLYDFHRGEESPFDVLLGLVAQTNGRVLVPGESISMGSEVIDSLPGCSVTLYETSTLLPVQEAYMASENAVGRVALASYDSAVHNWIIVPPSSGAGMQPTEPAAYRVAQAIVKKLEENNRS